MSVVNTNVYLSFFFAIYYIFTYSHLTTTCGVLENQILRIAIINKLDMSTARRRLKSPQSLYGTSTHPTIVTHRSQSWSWMIDSQPFLSMSISASTPIPQIKLFRTLNYKVKVMGVGKGQDHTVSPASNWFALFLFHINHITTPHIQLFWNLTLKNQRSSSWVRSKVKVT